MFDQVVPFFLRKPAFGTDQYGAGQVHIAQTVVFPAFISKNQRPRSIPFRQNCFQRRNWKNLGDCQPFRLLCGFDCYGMQPVQPHFVGLAPLCADRLDQADPHFGRLFHDPFRATSLDRRKQQPKVTGGIMRPNSFGWHGKAPSFAHICQVGLPFTVSSIEKPDRITFAATHHGYQIMNLALRQWHRLTIGQGQVNKETNSALLAQRFPFR